MKIAIIGAIGSGRTTLKRLLEAEGLNALTYITDSQLPDEDERTVCAEDFDKETILRTTDTKDGRRRFTTKEELDVADVLIVNHEQLMELAAIYPHESIRAIWCEPTPDAVENLALRLNMPEDRIREFTKTIEDMRELRLLKDKPENMYMAYVYANQYTDGNAMDFTKWVMNQLRIREHLKTVIWQCKAFGNLMSRSKDTTVVFFDSDNKSEGRDVPDDIFVDYVMHDDEGLANLMRSWMSNAIAVGVPENLSLEDNEPSDEESTGDEDMQTDIT